MNKILAIGMEGCEVNEEGGRRTAARVKHLNKDTLKSIWLWSVQWGLNSWFFFASERKKALHGILVNTSLHYLVCERLVSELYHYLLFFSLTSSYVSSIKVSSLTLAEGSHVNVFFRWNLQKFAQRANIILAQKVEEWISRSLFWQKKELYVDLCNLN